MYTHTHTLARRQRSGGDSHTVFAQLQPTIWGRISVIAAQLAPTHFLYQLCADIVVAVIQTAIIFLLQMLFIIDTRGYNTALHVCYLYTATLTAWGECLSLDSVKNF